MFSEKAGEPAHNHKVEVDGAGTGVTVSVSAGAVHTHDIKDWVMSPSEGMHDRGDDHIHKIEHASVAGYDMQDIPKVESPAGQPHTQININIGGSDLGHEMAEEVKKVEDSDGQE